MPNETPPITGNPMIDDPIEDVLERLAVAEERAAGGPFDANIFRRAFKELKASRELAEKLKKEVELLTMGYAKCGLCGQYDFPVNHHNDCAGCAQAQYGD